MPVNPVGNIKTPSKPLQFLKAASPISVIKFGKIKSPTKEEFEKEKPLIESVSDFSKSKLDLKPEQSLNALLPITSTPELTKRSVFKL